MRDDDSRWTLARACNAQLSHSSERKYLTSRGRIPDRLGVLCAQIFDRSGDGLALAGEVGRVETGLAQGALRIDEGRLERGDELNLRLEVRLGVRELLDELANLRGVSTMVSSQRRTWSCCSSSLRWTRGSTVRLSVDERFACEVLGESCGATDEPTDERTLREVAVEARLVCGPLGTAGNEVGGGGGGTEGGAVGGGARVTDDEA